jgi:hypothetical protein
MTVNANIQATVRETAADLLARLRPLEAAIAQDAAAGGTGDAFYVGVKETIDACVARLAGLGLTGPANQLPSSELWNAAGGLLARGWLQTQARTKPRGYAGDHEMLARIYENRLCSDPLGRQFDRYFQEEAAPQAVRNRMAMMCGWIVAEAQLRSQPWKISVVGSAFGLEVRDALAALAPAARALVRITLLDLDPAALDFARERLSPLLPGEHLQTSSGNLFRLPQRAVLAKHLVDSDLLLCPGLFDYLNDEDAIAMIRTFASALSPAGTLHLFQFAPHNPTRTYMEWLGNWYLTYRTADELHRLGLAAGLNAPQLTLGSESLGVDLLLSIGAR